MSGKKTTKGTGAKPVKDQVRFEPTLDMRVAKSRLQTALEDAAAILPEDNLSIDQLCRMAGTGMMRRWVKNPVVMNWMLDRDDFAHRAVAYADVVVDELYKIAMAPLDPDDRTITAKDKINAADKLLTLADKFPNKRKEIQFLDKDIQAMPDHEVDSTLEKYQKLLAESVLDSED